MVSKHLWRTLIVGWMVLMIGWLVFVIGWLNRWPCKMVSTASTNSTAADRRLLAERQAYSDKNIENKIQNLRAKRPVESPRPPSNPADLAQHDSQRDLFWEESTAIGLTVGYAGKMGVEPNILEEFTKAAIGLHHALAQGQLPAAMILHAAMNGKQHTVAAFGIEIAKDTHGDYMESREATLHKILQTSEKGWADLASQLGPDYRLDGLIHRLCQDLESNIALARQQYGFDRKTAAGVVWRQWLKLRLDLTADPEQRAAMQQMMVDP
jgi:hypothetical protein